MEEETDLAGIALCAIADHVIDLIDQQQEKCFDEWLRRELTSGEVTN